MAGDWRPLVVTGLAGGLLSAQARVNGQLATDLGGGSARAIVAASVSFSWGTLTLAVLVLASRAWRGAFTHGRPKWWECIGGLGGAALVSSSAAAVPLVGVALLSVMVVAGQTSGALIVDRTGLGPSGRHHLTPNRVIGAVVAVAGLGVATIGAPRGSLTIGLVLAVAASGMMVAGQQAVNGRLREHTGSALLAALISFVGGTVVLLLAWLGLELTHSIDGLHWPTEWWLYLGGFGGAAYIALSAATVKRLGVLRFSLASVGGQLAGGVILDLATPTGEVRPGSLFAVLLTIAAVAISSRPEAGGKRTAAAEGSHEKVDA